jgi:hypothetical protein
VCESEENEWFISLGFSNPLDQRLYFAVLLYKRSVVYLMSRGHFTVGTLYTRASLLGFPHLGSILLSFYYFRLCGSKNLKSCVWIGG